MSQPLVWGIIAVSVLQLAVPAGMLAGRERTLRTGEVFRFQTAPVDPYDAFRGRYVRLSVGMQTVPWSGEPLVRYRGEAYVTLAQGTNGYAEPVRASRTRPASGAYVRAQVWRGGAEAGTVQVRLPIERFYLPEDEAPAAERAYAQHSRQGNRSAEVLVRVRKGDLVVEDLVVDGTPIREWLAAQAREDGT